MNRTLYIFLCFLLWTVNQTNGLHCYECVGSSEKDNGCYSKLNSSLIIDCGKKTDVPDVSSCYKLQGKYQNVDTIVRRCFVPQFKTHCETGSVTSIGFDSTATVCICNENECNGNGSVHEKLIYQLLLIQIMLFIKFVYNSD